MATGKCGISTFISPMIPPLHSSEELIGLVRLRSARVVAGGASLVERSESRLAARYG